MVTALNLVFSGLFSRPTPRANIMTGNMPRPSPADPKRSHMLSAVRSKGNRSTELRMATLLRVWGLCGWRRHKPLPGRPDFTWERERVTLFVDGCFWHGCPRCYVAPRNNSSFWSDKLAENRERDKRVSAELRRQGWKVVRVWECRVDSASTRDRLRKALRQDK